MTTYRIHLNTISDYRKYVDLLSDYTFRGEVEVGGFTIPAYDIMEVFSHCPARELFFSVEAADEKNCKAIDKYLMKSGMLVRENQMTA